MEMNMLNHTFQKSYDHIPCNGFRVV